MAKKEVDCEEAAGVLEVDHMAALLPQIIALVNQIKNPKTRNAS